MTIIRKKLANKPFICYSQFEICEAVTHSIKFKKSNYEDNLINSFIQNDNLIYDSFKKASLYWVFEFFFEITF